MPNLRIHAKINGLISLKGSWIKSMIILGIVFLLGFGISKIDDAYRNVFNIPRLTSANYINTDVKSFAVQAVFTIISFFILVPLVLGMLEWYWNLTEGNKTGIGDIFAWYGSLRLYIKSILLNLDICIRVLLWWVLICGLPSAMIFISRYYSKGIDITSTNLSASEIQSLLISGLLLLFGTLLLIAGAILFVFIISKYVIAYFLAVEDNTRRIRDMIHDSIIYSHGYRWELTKFILSYIGWFITCIAILPIIYVVPYFLSSTAILSKHIIYSQRAKIKVSNLGNPVNA